MICRRGVGFPAPSAPGLKMRPKQRPAAGGGAFACARGRRWPTARLSNHPAPLACTVAARHLCGGQIPATMPVGQTVSRRRATIRSHPLADPLLPSGGPNRPASYGRLSCACGAIRFCSARRTAPPLALFAVAQPILSAMFGSLRAALANRSLPLARKKAFSRRSAHLRHQAALAQRALPPRPVAPPVPQVITATRSPRSGRRPSHFPQSARRRRRLPGGAGLAPRSRSPPAPRRCGEQPRRPIRLDLRPRSPPSVSPFEIPLPAAAQRQGPLDRQWRFSSRAPKSDSPPIMIIIKGGHRRRGSRRLHSCL